MSKQREALELALEALCNHSQPRDGYRRNELHLSPKPHIELYKEAINAIREALAEPEPVPVARIRTWTKAGIRHADFWDWEDGIESLHEGEHLLYTAPPARKPLTDEQINSLGDKIANEKLVGPVMDFRVRLARAIERAHGIGEP